MDGTERIIGLEYPGLSAIHPGLPAGVVGIRQDEVARGFGRNLT
jgi:hypothetical protein